MSNYITGGVPCYGFIFLSYLSYFKLKRLCAYCKLFLEYAFGALKCWAGPYDPMTAAFKLRSLQYCQTRIIVAFVDKIVRDRVTLSRLYVSHQ